MNIIKINLAVKIHSNINLSTNSFNQIYNDLKSFWEGLLKINFDQFPFFISNFYFKDHRFLLKHLNSDTEYVLSIIFSNDYIKEKIGINVLNSQSDVFFFGPVSFTLRNVSVHNLIFNPLIFPYLEGDNLDSYFFFLRFKTPVITTSSSSPFPPRFESNSLSIASIISLLNDRLNTFHLSVQSFFNSSDIPEDLCLQVENFHLKRSSYSLGFGLLGWIKLSFKNYFNLINQLFYYVAFFGLGPGGDSGFGFTEVSSFNYGF